MFDPRIMMLLLLVPMMLIDIFGVDTIPINAVIAHFLLYLKHTDARKDPYVVLKIFLTVHGD
jgi:hypothetical protein